MQGTMRQLIAQGITINGVKVDYTMLTVLVRCNIGKVIGKGDKPAHGRTPDVYSFDSTEEIRITNAEKE